MKTISLWLSFLACVGAGSLLTGLHLSAFVQPPAAILVFGPCLAYLFYCYGIAGAQKFMKRALSSQLTEDDEVFIDKLCTVAFIFAGVAAVIGLVYVMGNLSDSSKLGMGITIYFIGLLYGMIPAALLLPLRQKKAKIAPAPSQLRKAAGFVAISFLMLLGSFFVILYALGNVGH